MAWYDSFKSNSEPSKENPTGAPMIGNAHVDDFTMAMGALARMFGRNAYGQETAYSKAGTDVEQMGAGNKALRVKKEEPANLMAQRHMDELNAAIEAERGRALNPVMQGAPQPAWEAPNFLPEEGKAQVPFTQGVGSVQDEAANYVQAPEAVIPRIQMPEFPMASAEGRLEAAKKMASMTPQERAIQEAQLGEMQARTKLIGAQTSGEETLNPLRAKELEGNISTIPIRNESYQAQTEASRAQTAKEKEEFRFIAPKAEADIAAKRSEIKLNAAREIEVRASAKLHQVTAQYYGTLKDAQLDEMKSKAVNKAISDVSMREQAAEKTIIDAVTGKVNPIAKNDLGKGLITMGISQAAQAARGTTPDTAMGMVARGTMLRGLDNSITAINMLKSDQQQKAQITAVLQSLEGLKQLAPKAYQEYVGYLRTGLIAAPETRRGESFRPGKPGASFDVDKFIDQQTGSMKGLTTPKTIEQVILENP